MKKLLCICFTLSLVNCKSISVYNESQYTTTQNIAIGTIGLNKDFIIERDYNNVAIPKYDNPIKVNVSFIAFNKTSFKAFEDAKKNQNSTIDVVYNDSVDIKPRYLKLEVSDRLEVLNSLNSDANKSLFELLKTKKGAHLVTSVALVLSASEMMDLANAEELFLEGSGIKSYSLNTYKDGALQKVMKFNEGVIFAYQASNACWKQNDKYQLEIVDLVETNDKCPSYTYRSSKQAEKKIDYYKF